MLAVAPTRKRKCPVAKEDRKLRAGMALWAKYKRESYTAEVVETESGEARYRLADGREYRSPSAGGRAITGAACNGWVFWTVGEPGEKHTLRPGSPDEGDG